MPIIEVPFTTGADQRAIQQAVDRVAAEGGGEVRLGPGRWTLLDSVHLRTSVTLRGAGAATVLAKAPMVASPLVGFLGYGHGDISVAEPDRFEVGMGVYVTDDGAGGFYTTVATITWKDGERLGLSRWLNHDYHATKNGRARSLYPPISAVHVTDCAVRDLVIDGQKDANELLNGCRGGGVFLLQTARVQISGVTVRDFNGDGISFQQTRDTLVEGCVCEGNTGHGLHPGSGSVRPVMRGVTCRHNGQDGIYYCLRVSWSLTEDCVLEHNGGVGISVGGRDTDHWIRHNTIHHNAGPGLFFRPGDAYMGGHRCRVEANRIEGNATRTGEGQVVLRAVTRDVHLLDNRVRAHDREDQVGQTVVVEEGCGAVVLHGNDLQPIARVKVHGPAEAVHLGQPARELAVGPAAAPPDADRHLPPIGER